MVPLKNEYAGEVLIERLVVPQEVKFGESFLVRIVAWSARETSGRISLYRDGEFVGAQPVRLTAGKNVFAGNGPAPKFNDGLAKSNLASKGSLTAMKSAKTGIRRSGAAGAKMKSNKAFGQLKIAKGMSMLGAGANSAESSHTGAQAAFDGQTGTGDVEGGPGAPSGTVTSPSSTNPDTSAPNVEMPPGVTMDDSQAAMVAMMAAMAKQAGEMKKMAGTLMAVGIALIVAGIIVMHAAGWAFGIGLVIGMIMCAIGAVLIGISVMLGQMADSMLETSKSMSDALAQRTGDENQNRINKYCMDEAYNNGTDPKDCTPPDSVTNASRYNDASSRGTRLQEENNTTNGEVTDQNPNPQGLPPP